MLKAMIHIENYFTLNVFNSRLAMTELGYMEAKDSPTMIANNTLASPGHSLKQAGMHSSIVLILHDIIYAYHVAAQMWLLGRILPLVIGDLVPNDDERWSNFLLMVEIVDILFCPNLCEDNAVYLSTLFSDHHEQFSKLYPDDSIIPKMHFMVHMPRLIIQ